MGIIRNILAMSILYNNLHKNGIVTQSKPSLFMNMKLGISSAGKSLKKPVFGGLFSNLNLTKFFNMKMGAMEISTQETQQKAPLVGVNLNNIKSMTSDQVDSHMMMMQ